SHNSKCSIFRDILKTNRDLDDRSWKNLEIDGSGSNKVRQLWEVKTLLTVVDDTVTSGGARLLRSQLLQPSGDQAIIERRLDAVQELVENPHVSKRLHFLKPSHTIDRRCGINDKEGGKFGGKQGENYDTKIAKNIQTSFICLGTSLNTNLKRLLGPREFRGHVPKTLLDVFGDRIDLPNTSSNVPEDSEGVPKTLSAKDVLLRGTSTSNGGPFH
ncbi:unnamed protein product, partial [Heligmosomoides polygyrus]|uniref:MUTSd domain-containing protein n=1 Tax=Heligmosomoides polygyrus TaxID=6339 RepID=A0A183G3E9_HELPZ